MELNQLREVRAQITIYTRECKRGLNSAVQTPQLFTFSKLICICRTICHP